MSISPLWYYNSKRAFSINNVEGEYLSVLRGLDVEGVSYLQDWSAAPGLSLYSLSLSFCIAALKKKIYSVIKYRAITLKVKNSHRAERWVLQTPTETIWSSHSKWHLQLWACLLPFLGFCLVQRNTVCAHRHPHNLAKLQGKLRVSFPLPWEFQPLKSLSLCLAVSFKVPPCPPHVLNLDG